MTPALRQDSENDASSSLTPHRRNRLPLILLIVGVCVGLVWIEGYYHWPTDAASGQGVMGTLPPITPGKTTFRIATFNMHSGVGADDVFNFQRTIETVRDTDFCGLNEVRGWFFHRPANQAQELADATGHAWLFAPPRANIGTRILATV